MPPSHGASASARRSAAPCERCRTFFKPYRFTRQYNVLSAHEPIPITASTTKAAAPYITDGVEKLMEIIATTCAKPDPLSVTAQPKTTTLKERFCRTCNGSVDLIHRKACTADGTHCTAFVSPFTVRFIDKIPPWSASTGDYRNSLRPNVPRPP